MIKLKKLGTLLLALALCLALGVPAFAADVLVGLEDAYGKITVSNNESTATASAYPIIGVHLDKDGNPTATGYIWVEEVKPWIQTNYPAYISSATGAVTEAYTALTPVQLSELIQEMWQEGVFTRPAGISVTGNGDITSLPAGSYAVLVSGGVNVYTPVVVTLTQEYKNGAWTVNDAATTLKYTAPTIDKKVNGLDEDTAGIGDKVTYTIETTVPFYPANALEKKYAIGDTLPAGLTFDEGSVRVFLDNEELFVGDGCYTIELGNGATFTVHFDYDKLVQANGSLSFTGAEKITVEYKAILNDSAVIGAGGNINGATLTYQNKPYKNGGYKTVEDKTPVYVFGIEATKIEKDNAGVTLAGATFTVKKQGGTDNIKFIGADGVYKVAVNQTDATATESVVTGADGKLVLTGLDEGTYELTETIAPKGYNLPAAPFTITITANKTEGVLNGTVENESLANVGHTATNIENAKGFTLPATGGMGTMLFTLGGLTLMAGAVVVLIVSRKRRTCAD